MPQTLKLNRLIYLLALLKFIFPFLIQNSIYEPHRDEFLYLAEGRHLAWGYLEVPPLMSVMASITDALGGSLFWIRLWPSLFGALTWMVVGRLILLLGGKGFALLLGFLPFVFGYLVHVHYIFQPNFLEVFFWTTMAYGFVLAATADSRGLYIAGTSWGLGMMSKYSVAFFAAALLVGLLLTKERRLLRNKHFYYAFLTGLAIFLPNIIWQGIHGFPIVYHMKELQRQQLDNVSQAGFLMDQLSFNLPGILIWGMGLYWTGCTRSGRPYRFVALAVVIVLAFLTVSHGKSYYAMGAYPILFGFGAIGLERLTANRNILWRYALAAWSIITGCYLDTVTLPFLPPQQLVDWYSRNDIFRRLGFLRWEDQQDHPLPQDFADMLGWRELTEKAAKAYHSLDRAEQNQAVPGGDNFGESGALDYYGAALHLPSPIGTSASYLLWTPEDFYRHNILVLASDDRGKTYSDYTQEFQSVVFADSVTMPYARELGSYIILLKYPTEKFRKEWQDDYTNRRKKTSLFR
jgi:hypothetical protein